MPYRLCVSVDLPVDAGRDVPAAAAGITAGDEVSVSVTAELDPSLLSRPAELRRRIADLNALAYTLAARALGPQAAMAPPGAPAELPVPAAGMTATQRHAVGSLAGWLGTDLDYECREIVGAAFDDLTVRQAADLIDHLKSLIPS